MAIRFILCWVLWMLFLALITMGWLFVECRGGDIMLKTGWGRADGEFGV